MDRDAGLLIDIFLYAERVVQYVRDCTFHDFQHDAKTQDAVLYALTVIGEAVRRLSEDFKDANPDIPWNKIVAARNLIVHEYGRVDTAEVWRIGKCEVPALIEEIEPLLPPKP